MVGVAERFAGEFARGIGRDGGKDGVALAEGDLGIHAVDGGGGGERHFFHAVLAGGLEEVDGAFDVDALIERGMVEAGADAGAGGEMDDLVEFYGSEEFADGAGGADVALDEFEGFGERLEAADIGALELRIVKVIELVECPDGMAVVQEAFANVRADEARAAGDEKVHGTKLNRWGEGVEQEARAWLRPSRLIDRFQLEPHFFHHLHLALFNLKHG